MTKSTTNNQLRIIGLICTIFLCSHAIYNVTTILFAVNTKDISSPLIVLTPQVVSLLISCLGLYGFYQLKPDGRSNRILRIFRVLQLIQCVYVPFTFWYILKEWSSGSALFVAIETPRLIFQLLIVIVSVLLLWILVNLHYRNEQREQVLADNLTFERVPRSIRFTNFIFDVLGSLYLSGILFSLLLTIFHEYQYLIQSNLFTNLLGLLAFLLYFMLTEGVYGQSLGKAISNTRVFYHPIVASKFRSIRIRSISRLVPFEGFSIFSNDLVMWHDEWSDTEVLPYNLNASPVQVSRFHDDDDILDAGVIVEEEE